MARASNKPSCTCTNGSGISSYYHTPVFLDTTCRGWQIGNRVLLLCAAARSAWNVCDILGMALVFVWFFLTWALMLSQVRRAAAATSPTQPHIKTSSTPGIHAAAAAVQTLRTAHAWQDHLHAMCSLPQATGTAG
jgi:hypothetical protein